MNVDDFINGLAAGGYPFAEDDDEELEERTPGETLTNLLKDPFVVLNSHIVLKVPENQLRPIFERLIQECGASYPGNEAAVKARVILSYNVSVIYGVLKAKGVKLR